MKITRRQKWALGVVLAGALILVLVMRPDVVVVDLVRVTPGPLRVTIDEEGMTRFRRHADIAAPVTGRLLENPLRAGDTVARGQVVARLAPAPLDERTRLRAEAAVAAAGSLIAQAEAKAAQAESLLGDAQREYARAERLHAAGALSDRAFEAAQVSVSLRERERDAARSALAAASQDERQARMALLGAGSSGRTGIVDVRTPIGGRVLRLALEHERVVLAGTPLLEVGDPDDIEIVIDVLSSDAARIRVGGRIVARIPQGLEFEAAVTRVEPAAFTKVSPLGVEEQRVNVLARPASPPVGLGDGFRVVTSIVVWSAESVLTVPSTSLVPGDEMWGVYVVEKGRARFRAVTLGEQGTRAVEARAGLRSGDLVIEHPNERIREGVRVTAR